MVAGQKTGGRFKEHERGQAEAPNLEPDWGSVSLQVGGHTPWGEAQSVQELAPGITIVDTDSHGGVRLSPERNAAIPAALRRSSRWYEEDCDLSIVASQFPEAFDYHRTGDIDSIRERHIANVKDYYPDEWEKATGEIVTAAESRARDQQEFDARTRDRMVARARYSAITDPDSVVVMAKRSADGADAEFLVPRTEIGDKVHRFVVDETRHPMLPPAEPTPENEADKPKPVVVDLALVQNDNSVTTAAKNRIMSDLTQRWRDENGNVRTFHTILAEDGAVERAVYTEGVSRSYAIVGKDCSSYRVSKATWDYLADRIPDRRTPAQVAAQDLAIAHAKLEKDDRWDLTKTRKLRDTYEALKRRTEALREAERKADIAANGTWEEQAERSDRERRQAQAARERLAKITIE